MQVRIKQHLGGGEHGALDGRVAGLGRRELHDAAALGAAVGVGRHARVDDVEAGLAEEVLQVVPLHGRVEARDEDARPLEVAAAGVARAVAREVGPLAALVEERLGRRLSMVDDYVKVLNMIEIEVEMETQIPAAEYQGGLFSYRAVHCFLGHVFFKGSEDIWKASLS